MDVGLLLVNIGLIIMLLASLGLTIIGMPGNIVIFLTALAYGFYDHFVHLSLMDLGIVLGAIILGEVFEKHEEGDTISYLISNEIVDQRLRYKGYPVRVSDKIPDTRKAWCAYQERRILEDTLKTLKTRSSCVRNCVSDNESLIGKTFVLFLVASIEMIVRARLRKYFEGGKTSDSLPTDYDRSCRVIDSLNNVIQTKFCDGYYFGGSAEKKCGLFEALGVSVPGSEPEEERDYEDEEETES